MPFIRVPIPLLAIVVVWAASGAAAADEPPLTSADVRKLLRRLEAAESTIGELQQELETIKRRQKSALATPVRPDDRRRVESEPAAVVESESEAPRTPLRSRPPTAFIDAVSAGDDAEFGLAESAGTSTAYEEEPGDDELRQLVSDLEKRWDEQLELNETFSSQLERAATSGTSLSTMRIVGRVHVDHWAFPGTSPGANAFETGDSTETPNDRIGFRRLRFGVRGDVWENMTYRIEMEFAGGNDTEFRDAWIGFKHLPFIQTLRIGNQKRPYGLDHLNSSRYNVFLERPFVIESFNQDARRLGICAYGVSDDLAYNWRYGVFNQRLIQDEGNYISDHYQGEIAGRFANTLWYDECSGGRGYAHWAVSGTVAHPDGSTPADNGNIGRDANEARFRHRPEARSTNRWLDTGRIAGADWYQLAGVEGVINIGALQVVGEYQHVSLQRDAGFGPDLGFHGGYAYASYFLTGEHMPWNRRTGTLGRVKPFENFFLVRNCDGSIGSGWGAWQVALRYSYADFTDDNIFGGVGESVTFGLNWYWNPNARMQFNYIHGEISDRNVVDNNGLLLTGGDYDIVGTRFMIDF